MSTSAKDLQVHSSVMDGPATQYGSAPPISPHSCHCRLTCIRSFCIVLLADKLAPILFRASCLCRRLPQDFSGILGGIRRKWKIVVLFTQNEKELRQECQFVCHPGNSPDKEQRLCWADEQNSWLRSCACASGLHCGSYSCAFVAVASFPCMRRP